MNLFVKLFGYKWIVTTLSMIAFFSSAHCEEKHKERLLEADIGFQERWCEFQKTTEPFAKWQSDWTVEELKSRFDQMTMKRWQVYFINPEDLPDGERLYQPAFEMPESFHSWGSRSSFPVCFKYNLASDSYNASIITLHGKQFLAMEAPTRENFSIFCKVLADYQVTDLVRLTPAKTNDKENSFPYWDGHMDLCSKTGLNTVEINDKELNYYFTDRWENHEGMEPEKLAALVKSVMNQNQDSQMIAVHCRAGVGRTGTFMAAYALIQSIDAQIKSGVDIDKIHLSIDQIIWELSLQRAFMIGHFSQYESLYRLANWYVDSIKASKKDQPVSYPNYAGKWTLPSLITPERSLAYQQSHQLLPTCPPPKTVIFCYSKTYLNRVLENYPTHPCDGKLKELYFFDEYPDVAIVYYGQGAPSNAMRLEYLISWGVKRCISIGSAGGLQKDLSIGDLVVCDQAIRDEGTSHHYLPPEKYAHPSKEFTANLCQILDEMNISYRKGSSWTTDGFYRQTKEEIDRYQKEGVLTVEMEAAALFSVAAVNHAEIVSLFTISDTLGDLEWKPDFENSKKFEGFDLLVKAALKTASPKPQPQAKAIEIVPYDPSWPEQYEKEAGPIQSALGDNCVAIHHFGSTSVPLLSAKPKIDILAIVKQLEAINTPALENLGFQARGEVIKSGQYFSKDLPKVHLHIFEDGNPLIHQNLVFRDWLRTHEEDRDAYAALKNKLAEEYTDGMDYCHAKTAFIEQIIAKATQNQ